MADEGLMLVELPEAVTVADTDLVYLVSDLATLAASKRISIGNLKLAIGGKIAAGVNTQLQYNKNGALAGTPTVQYIDSPTHPMVQITSPGRVDPVVAGATFYLQAAPVDNASYFGTTAPFLIIRTTTAGYVSLDCGGQLVYLTGQGFWSPDNTSYLGTPTNRWIQAHVKEAVVLGTTPALSGAVRLANATGVYARNAANTADRSLLTTDSSDQIAVGDYASAYTFVKGGRVHLADTRGSVISITENGLGITSGPGPIYVSGNLWGNPDNTYDFGEPSNPLRFRTAYLGTSVVIGTNPSSTGALRLAYGDWIKSRNSTNTADCRMMQVAAGSQLIIGGDTTYTTLLDSYVQFNGSVVYGLGSLAIGANAAQSGALRLQNVSSIRARNAANTADLDLVSCSNADNLVFGNLTSVNYWQGSIVNLESGNYVYISTPTGNYYLTGQVFQPVTDSGPSLGHAAARWNSAYLSSHIAIADVPALSGDVRLANSHPINWRSANNAYDIGIYMDGAPSLRTPTIMPQGDGNYALGYPTLRWVYACISDNVQIGTTPALSGALRLANDAGVYARNAANTADRRLLNLNVDNDVIVGSGGGGSTQLHGTLIYMLAGETVYVVDQAYFCPIPNGTISLGLASNRWKDGWFAGTVQAGGLGTTPIDATKLVGMVPPASLPAAGGGGDVVGPAGATDSALAVYSGATGKIIKNTALFVTGARLAISGVSAAFPALRNSGADLEAVLADNSNWALLRAGRFVSTQTGNNLQDLTVVGATSFVTLTASSTLTCGGVSCGGNIHNTAGYVFPGRADLSGGYQGSWYLGSHGSYGLYTNTGLYCAGSIWTAGWFYEPGRAAPQGHWTAVAYNAANFSASSGTWTVEAGDQVTYSYMIIGKTMWVNFDIYGTSCSTTIAELRIACPLGAVATKNAHAIIFYLDAGVTGQGHVYVSAGTNYIVCRRYSTSYGNWNTCTNTNALRGSICFEFN